MTQLATEHLRSSEGKGATGSLPGENGIMEYEVRRFSYLSSGTGLRVRRNSKGSDHQRCRELGLGMLCPKLAE